MSLFNRFTRAVRARVGHHTSRSVDDEADFEHAEPESPSWSPRPEAPRDFAVGDRVVVQHDGVCEIVALRSLELDERPLPVFEMRSRRGQRVIPVARARALMRHVVSPEGAELARRLLFAQQPVDTSVGELEVAWMKLDLGPQAQALRSLYARTRPLSPRELTLFESVLEVVCDELEFVLRLQPGSMSEALSARFGAPPRA